MNKFYGLFGEKAIIGMAHLAGDSRGERVRRALEETMIYEGEGVSGVIVEDYHGTHEDLVETLEHLSREDVALAVGVNVLRDPYSSFELAKRFGGSFVQFDSVQMRGPDFSRYDALRSQHPDIVVLGGVGFKYVPPTGNPLVTDVDEGMQRCDAVVTTGEGTGVETPITKLMGYRAILGMFPLVVGAGVTLDNVVEQMRLCDGAIVGSYFKPDGNTHAKVDRVRVRDLVQAVKGS